MKLMQPLNGVEEIYTVGENKRKEAVGEIPTE